jgi:hypothetical protein
MKPLLVAVLLVLALASCQTMQSNGPQTKPTAFCTIVKEPDPVLLGGWKCIAPLQLETGALEINPVEYWLYKFDDGYALYFERKARDGRKRYRGWQSWTISGKEITSTTGITIYTENGEVFFRFKDERAAKMTRIESSTPKSK